MKITWYLISMLLFFGTTSCKKNTDVIPKEEGTKFAAPAWNADEIGNFPASMTAVVVLPATLQATASETDQLAAFINNQCRGLGVIVKVDSTSVYFILIHGLAEEQSQVVFKYYSAKTSYLYQTAPVLHFLIDEVYGTAQNPEVLALSPVK